MQKYLPAIAGVYTLPETPKSPFLKGLTFGMEKLLDLLHERRQPLKGLGLGRK